MAAAPVGAAHGPDHLKRVPEQRVHQRRLPDAAVAREDRDRGPAAAPVARPGRRRSPPRWRRSAGRAARRCESRAATPRDRTCSGRARADAAVLADHQEAIYQLRVERRAARPPPRSPRRRRWRRGPPPRARTRSAASGPRGCGPAGVRRGSIPTTSRRPSRPWTIWTRSPTATTAWLLEQLAAELRLVRGGADQHAQLAAALDARHQPDLDDLRAGLSRERPSRRAPCRCGAPSPSRTLRRLARRPVEGPATCRSERWAPPRRGRLASRSYAPAPRRPPVAAARPSRARAGLAAFRPRVSRSCFDMRASLHRRRVCASGRRSAP